MLACRSCEHHACAGVYVEQVLLTSANIFAYMLATGCAYALMHVQFVHSAFGNEGGGLELVYESTSCLAWGVIYDRRRDRGVVYVFSILTRVGMYVGVVEYTHTHTRTHTAHKGYSYVSPGVRMRHLQGPRNPDGLNLGIHIFVYVYKVHMCMHTF